MIKVLSLILNYFPLVVVPVVFILAVLFFWKKKKFFFLIWVMVGFHLGLALIKSILQYLVWNQGGMMKIALNLPLEKMKLGWFENLPIFTNYSHGYFSYYIWNHFWKEAVLSVVAAALGYFIFRVLQKYKKNIFLERESEFGFLIMLIVGWPQILMFIPLVLLVAVIFSVVNWFRKHEASCSLFLPLAVSAAIMLIFSGPLQYLRFLLVNF
jgi:hypothetical protein